MIIAKIAEILTDHGVMYYTENGRIFADSMIAGTNVFEKVEDCTDWTPARLYNWLGWGHEQKSNCLGY